MKIIEIQALDNGGHRNQTGLFSELPEGWARIPDEMETPNFPFGDIEAEDEDIIKGETVSKIEIVDGEAVVKSEKVPKVIGTRKVVTKWTAGTMPEVEESEHPISETEQLRADIDYIAIMTGVEL